MKHLFAILLAIQLFHASGQGNGLPIKEQFDIVDHKLVFNGTYDGVVSYLTDNPNANPWNGYAFGEQVGYLLEGYLRMYETTRDKAYLIRFINLGLRAIAWRRSTLYFTDLESHYMNGVLLWPLAHYVHLVVADHPELSALQISGTPDGLVVPVASTIAVNQLPSQTVYTYGEIADWIMYRCVESLDAIIDEHWGWDNAFFHGEKIEGLNQDAGFAGAMLYLGHLAWVDNAYSGLASYWDKAARQVVLLTGNEANDLCECDNGGAVLRANPNNSFWWWHRGYSFDFRNCPVSCTAVPRYNQPDLEHLHQFVEDISHGVIDLEIPMLADRFNLYTNGGEPFTGAEVVKFRNAFTQHIAEWNGTDWDIHSAVDGSDASCYDCVAMNEFRTHATGWMPLQMYDEDDDAAAGSSVYQILMDIYANHIFNDPVATVRSGLQHMGVASVVAAQWEQECFDLTLFNRDLVYDQDFAARGILTVDPAGESGASFADPVITEPRFTVKDQIHCQLRAGSAVVLSPGFEAEAGSTVEVVIDPLGCNMAYRSLLQDSGQTIAGMSAQPTATETTSIPVAESQEATISDAIRLLRGTDMHVATVWLDLVQDRTIQLELHDAIGRIVQQQPTMLMNPGVHELAVDLSGLGRGIYFCTVRSDGSSTVFKLLVE